ncbi:J domain-containing protein [Sphingopyxis sp. OPL5]|uniref:J domain-containing protein n=1 Tax=Sphingopyxis sp. OPL5 TaxID=2486273 RepID=UPI00164D1F2F|nr:J domain-containing protein [Sphingopyxis sp. OPL5]
MPREDRCAAPGCREAGEFRAPIPATRSPDGPPQYRWLCLDHVREFNSGYNYFEGMSADQILAAQTPTAGWETESRTFRPAGSADLPPRWADFKDPIDALGARFRQRMDEARREAANPGLSREEHAAMQLLGLPADADRAALRRRYSELVRKYHPDRNGGDRSHEARLGEVVAAYQLLRKTKAFA